MARGAVGTHLPPSMTANNRFQRIPFARPANSTSRAWGSLGLTLLLVGLLVALAVASSLAFGQGSGAPVYALLAA